MSLEFEWFGLFWKWSLGSEGGELGFETQMEIWVHGEAVMIYDFAPCLHIYLHVYMFWMLNLILFNSIRIIHIRWTVMRSREGTLHWQSYALHLSTCQKLLFVTNLWCCRFEIRFLRVTWLSYFLTYSFLLIDFGATFISRPHIFDEKITLERNETEHRRTDMLINVRSRSWWGYIIVLMVSSNTASRSLKSVRNVELMMWDLTWTWKNFWKVIHKIVV